jgi:nucleotide-binding universal stress UspA family protein
MLANRRILCPTDFSDFSERALEQAIALADPRETRITLLHVVPPLIPPAAAMPFPVTPTLDARARGVALEALSRFGEPARAAGIETELEVREGSIAGQVVKIAEALPADLVVIGTHGLTGFDRFMLGSVTEKVLHRVGCPVLTVPRALQGRPPARPGRFQTVLCPLDFADPSARALHGPGALRLHGPARGERGRLPRAHRAVRRWCDAGGEASASSLVRVRSADDLVAGLQCCAQPSAPSRAAPSASAHRAAPPLPPLLT